MASELVLSGGAEGDRTLEPAALRVCSKFLQHSHIQVALDTYSRVLPSMQREAGARLACNCAG